MNAQFFVKINTDPCKEAIPVKATSKLGAAKTLLREGIRLSSPSKFVGRKLRADEHVNVWTVFEWRHKSEPAKFTTDDL